MHCSLLHREALARNRATVLSINSMVGFGSFSVIRSAAGLLAVQHVQPGRHGHRRSLFSLIGA